MAAMPEDEVRNLNKAVSAIKSQVSFHPLVGVEPNFAQPETDGSLVGKIKQCRSISLSLCIRLYGYAVDQQMICPYFEDSDPRWLIFNFALLHGSTSERSQAPAAAFT